MVLQALRFANQNLGITYGYPVIRLFGALDAMYALDSKGGDISDGRDDSCRLWAAILIPAACFQRIVRHAVLSASESEFLSVFFAIGATRISVLTPARSAPALRG